jgi:hypothetical protein
VSPLRAEEAYAIGEMLEVFLCEPDSEAFARTFEELQHEQQGGSTLSPVAPLMSGDSTSTFAQLARAKKREGGNVRRSSSSTRLSSSAAPPTDLLKAPPVTSNSMTDLSRQAECAGGAARLTLPRPAA